MNSYSHYYERYMSSPVDFGSEASPVPCSTGCEGNRFARAAVRWSDRK